MKGQIVEVKRLDTGEVYPSINAAAAARVMPTTGDMKKGRHKNMKTYQFKVQYQAAGYVTVFLTLGLLPAALDHFRGFGQTVLTMIIAGAVLIGGIFLAEGKFLIDEDKINDF